MFFSLDGGGLATSGYIVVIAIAATLSRYGFTGSHPARSHVPRARVAKAKIYT